MDRVRERTRPIRTWSATVGIAPGSTTTYGGRLDSYQRTADEMWNGEYHARQLERLVAKGHQSDAVKRVLADLRNNRDLGGKFLSQSSSYELLCPRIDASRSAGGGLFRVFSGDVLPIQVPVQAALLQPSTDAELFAVGGRMARLCAPTNPGADLSVALLELREGLPSIPALSLWRAKGIAARSKAAGGEYLNVVFGWKPMLKDINDVYTTALVAEGLWAQYVKDSGKHVRRHYSYMPTTTTVITDMGLSYGWPVTTTQLYTSRGRLTKTVSTTTRQWFSGCFRYRVPERDSTKVSALKYEAAKWRKLYGLTISPEVLWNIAPWSWLSDWLVDFGGLMKAISTAWQDGLVLQYGYVMEHKVEVTTYDLVGLNFYGQPPVNTSLSIRRESKVRHRATPFGFGLQSSAFTDKQWAILAALGISRGR